MLPIRPGHQNRALRTFQARQYRLLNTLGLAVTGSYQEKGHENGCRGISSINSPKMKAIRAVLVELGHFEIAH